MMKRIPLTACLILSMLAFPVLPVSLTAPQRLSAEEGNLSLVIAPPPVGYPLIEAGAQTRHAGANFVYSSMDMMDTSLTLLGGTVFADRQICPTGFLALSGNAGATFLAGSEYNLLMLQVPLTGSVILRAITVPHFSLFAFAGAGVTAGLTNMTITFTYPIPPTSTFVDDDTSVTSTVVTGSATGGLQANISAGPFIVSPFGLMTVTAGRYSTTIESTMSYVYPSDSGTIDAVSATVLGFDILYEPRGISLSSQFRNSRDYRMFTVSLRWLLAPR